MSIHFRHYLVLSLALIMAAPAGAVTVRECEDDQGNRSFAEACPPGSKEVNKKDYSTTSPDPSAGKPAAKLTLYTVPNCDSCAQVKEFLSVRNIGVEEKDVSNDAALQEELKEKAGDLRVPVLLVGDQVLNGYNRTALLEALAAAGYAEKAE